MNYELAYNLFNNILCDTQSNTFFKSRNMLPTIFTESNAIDTFSVKAIMAWVVLCCFLNPNCLLYKIALSSRKSITESLLIMLPNYSSVIALNIKLVFALSGKYLLKLLVTSLFWHSGSPVLMKKSLNAFAICL